MNTSPALAEYARFFCELTPERLDRLPELFAPDARFKDPFNDVRGVAAIRQVFVHMYDSLQAPRFVVLDQASNGCIGYLHWQFQFSRRGDTTLRSITGMSRVVFDAEGRALEHLDFWDPAQQLYERLPLLGLLMRWLRSRLSAQRGSR